MLGFRNVEDFAPVIGWELYQVTLDKYHVMFWFQNGWALLNVAHSFSHRSADGLVDYTYEISGSHKQVELDRILRLAVVTIDIVAPDRLALRFENNDELIVHDHPDMRSWWFYLRESSREIPKPDKTIWVQSDIDPEDLSPEEFAKWDARMKAKGKFNAR